MRKHCRRHVRPKAPPMLIARGMLGPDLELLERQYVEAFAGGYATAEHFDGLADMRNLLTIAAAHKDDAQALAMCDLMREPMGAIRERHARTGRMGVTGAELQFMREFVSYYRDWWLRQSASLYRECSEALQVAIGSKGPAMEGEAA